MGKESRSNPFGKWIREQEIGPRDVLDRFGRVISPDDIVQLGSHPGTLWRVVEIVPDLRPDAPAANTVRMTVTTIEHIGVAGRTPILDLIKVRDRSEYIAEGAPQAVEPTNGEALAGTPEEGLPTSPPAPISGSRLVTES